MTLLLGLCLLLLLTAFTPQAVLERFFTEAEAQADWFAEDFLAQVPLAQIEKLRGQLTDQQAAFAEGEVALISDFETSDLTTNFGAAWQP